MQLDQQMNEVMGMNEAVDLRGAPVGYKYATIRILHTSQFISMLVPSSTRHLDRSKSSTRPKEKLTELHGRDYYTNMDSFL